MKRSTTLQLKMLAFLTLALFPLTFTNCTNQANPTGTEGSITKAPLLLYSFNEKEGELASNQGSGGKLLNAQVNGGKIEWQQGLFDGAARLSDKGHFKLADGIVEQLTDFTLSTWVYIDEQSDNQTVCTFARGTDEYLILTTQRGDREHGVSLVMTKGSDRNERNHTNKEERIAYSGQPERLSTNAWHHLVFTLEGSVGTLFVDGIKAEVKNDFTTNPSKLGRTTDNYIGRPTWNDPYLNGMIDDFRLYDYALTEEQVYELSSLADPILVKNDQSKLSLNGLSAVIDNLTLPQAGESGSTITWKSNKPKVITDEGVVYRPDAGSGDTRVILTASLQKGKNKQTKKFTATVKDLGEAPADLNVYSMQTGNPTVPAYLADASFYYDKETDTFYAYGTNDGAGGGNVYPTQMWHSKDCKTWKNEIVVFPKSWTDYAGTVAVWAPSIEYSPATKKYYLMYSIASKTFVGMADHPLGPWVDANGAAPGKMLFQGYDGQFFIDDDHTMYIVTDAWNFKLMKFKYDEQGRLLFDNDNPLYDQQGSNEFVGEYKYRQINEIRNAFEASLLYKRNGLYYLMWSFNGSENYNVRYAVSEKVTGPYREINDSMTYPILQRDDRNDILGPGHHSMFDYDGRTFIAYHRQHFPFIDSKRQTCIEEVFFNADGSIQPITPTHRGTVVVPNAPDNGKKNIALGKQTMVSSAREYDSTTKARRYRTYDISFAFAGNFAVDENYGTRWDAGIGAENPWLIVDLGADCSIDEIETYFEFTSRTYTYRLEYLPQSVAADLEAASTSKDWKLFADRNTGGAPLSPVTDKAGNGQSVDGRYVRLTVYSADNLPPSADEWGDAVNAPNTLSLFELKVFGIDNANDLGRRFEAESYHNCYGARFEICSPTNLCMVSDRNNDYLLYENIDWGDGASTITARLASSREGQLNIHLDSLNTEPAGILTVPNTDNEWMELTATLNETVKGQQERVYLVFKSEIGTSGAIRMDWFNINKEQ